jgi:hypothetical protein
MGQQRRSFTPEFKQDAVDLCRRSGFRQRFSYEAGVVLVILDEQNAHPVSFCAEEAVRPLSNRAQNPSLRCQAPC